MVISVFMFILVQKHKYVGCACLSGNEIWACLWSCKAREQHEVPVSNFRRVFKIFRFCATAEPAQRPLAEHELACPADG